MMQQQVLTIFKGSVCAKETKVYACRVHGIPLTFVHKESLTQMTISALHIEALQIGRSGPFNDQFGGAPYHLVYFKWAPDVEQGQLLP